MEAPCGYASARNVPVYWCEILLSQEPASAVELHGFMVACKVQEVAESHGGCRWWLAPGATGRPRGIRFIPFAQEHVRFFCDCEP